MTSVRALSYQHYESFEVDPEDERNLIKRRLTEVRRMIRPHRLITNPLNEFTPEIRSIIEKYQNLTPLDLKMKNRICEKSDCWQFKRAARMIILLLRGFKNTKRLLEYGDGDNFHVSKQLHRNNISAGKCRASLSLQTRLSLRTQPRYRDKSAIKQIQSLLSVTGAFKDLYPAELIAELTRYVDYARFDNGRIIAYQGKPPEHLYFILTGRVNLLCQFGLAREDIVQNVGWLRKYQTTHVEEFVNQWPLEYNLIAEDQLEVLLVHRDVYRYLQKIAAENVIPFLRTLKEFETLNLDAAEDKTNAIECRFYRDEVFRIVSTRASFAIRQSLVQRKNQIVVPDTSRTSWLYVIKSGSVKLIRYQTKIDLRKLQERQRTVSNLSYRSDLSPVRKHRTTKTTRSQNGYHHNKTTNLDSEDLINNRKSQNGKEFLLQQDIFSDGTKMNLLESEDSIVSSVTDSSSGSGWGTGQQIPRKYTYVVLDVLKAGEIVGLDRLRPKTELDQSTCRSTLMSEGAEIIQICKKFFLQHIGKDFLHKADILVKEYMTESEVEEKLLMDATWKSYRNNALLEATNRIKKPKPKSLI